MIPKLLSLGQTSKRLAHQQLRSSSLRALGCGTGRPSSQKDFVFGCAEPSQIVTSQETKGHSFSKLAASLSFGLAAIIAFRKSIECEEVPVDVKLVTYNVLSPNLCHPSHYPRNDPKELDKKSRWPKIVRRLEDAVSDGRIIGLQEVNLEWAGQLHVFFAERDYAVVFAQYGNANSGYMGVVLAWPRKSYEALKVEICKLSDSAPKGTWPKEPNSSLSPFGYVNFFGLKEILGCNPPEFQKTNGEWKLAQGRNNEAIFLKLRPRDSTKSFCVATYHMPCLFGSVEKVRAVNIHTQLLMSKLSKFAEGDPVAVMGDYNIKPDSSTYQLFNSGGSVKTLLATAQKQEVEGMSQLVEAVPFPEGLQSAYKAYYGKEPLFTNFAFSEMSKEPFVETLDYVWFNPGKFQVVDCKELPKTKEEVKGPFPNQAEPSDHLPLHVTLRVS